MAYLLQGGAWCGVCVWGGANGNQACVSKRARGIRRQSRGFFKRQSERLSVANECALADETRFSTPASKGRNKFRIPEGKDGYRARKVFDGGSADKEVMT